MADRPIFTLLGFLVLNFIISLHGKHVIVKRELVEDDDIARVDLSADLLEERRFPEKRDLFWQSTETHVVSPGKIVDEEADDNSDPDGAEESSGDVSGSGYQRENVSEQGADADGNSEDEEESEKSIDDAETKESEDAKFAEEKAGAIPDTVGKSETKRQFIAHPRSHYYSHPGYVYLKAPPIRQKTIVTTRIPRPPIMMSYKQFLHRLARERFHDGYHSPYHVDDGDDDEYAEHEHEEGKCVLRRTFYSTGKIYSHFRVIIELRFEHLFKMFL